MLQLRHERNHFNPVFNICIVSPFSCLFIDHIWTDWTSGSQQKDPERRDPISEEETAADELIHLDEPIHLDKVIHFQVLVIKLEYHKKLI